jgi:hypothetical protein
MDGQKAVILAQVGHFYFDAVGQFSIGGDKHQRFPTVVTKTCQGRVRL